MQIGWKHFFVWACLTAAITFILVTFGGAAIQIIEQVFGVHLATTAEMTPGMFAAVVLCSMFPAAVLTLAGTILLYVFAQFAAFDRDFNRRN